MLRTILCTSGSNRSLVETAAGSCAPKLQDAVTQRSAATNRTKSDENLSKTLGPTSRRLTEMPIISANRHGATTCDGPTTQQCRPPSFEVTSLKYLAPERFQFESMSAVTLMLIRPPRTHPSQRGLAVGRTRCVAADRLGEHKPIRKENLVGPRCTRTVTLEFART